MDVFYAIQIHDDASFDCFNLSYLKSFFCRSTAGPKCSRSTDSLFKAALFCFVSVEKQTSGRERSRKWRMEQDSEMARLHKACWVRPLLKNQQGNLMKPPEESGRQSPAPRHQKAAEVKHSTQPYQTSRLQQKSKSTCVIISPKVHFQSFINMSVKPCGFAIKIWG